MCPQFYEKVELRLSEHGDVNETQAIRFGPQKFFSKLGRWLDTFFYNNHYTKRVDLVEVWLLDVYN